MNKDQVQGKVKDVAGRIERQAGEWTGDAEKQVHGALKQVEGKVQNAWGNVKDAEKKAVDTKNESVDDSAGTEEIDVRSRRKAELASLCGKAAGLMDQGFASVYFRHMLKTLLRDIGSSQASG
jgi:uncharacterized protein YjbJ (UPF0337 family)